MREIIILLSLLSYPPLVRSAPFVFPLVRAVLLKSLSRAPHLAFVASHHGTASLEGSAELIYRPRRAISKKEEA